MLPLLRFAAVCAGMALVAGPAPAAATPLRPPEPAAVGRALEPAAQTGRWEVLADGRSTPMPARLGWVVEGWDSFVTILMTCDPDTRTVRVELELAEEDVGQIVTRRIQHGSGTLTVTDRPPDTPDGEGMFWMESIRSYDEIAPALAVPAPWSIDGGTQVLLRDPGAARAFRAFRLACGISGR